MRPDDLAHLGEVVVLPVYLCHQPSLSARRAFCGERTLVFVEGFDRAIAKDCEKMNCESHGVRI